MATGPRTSSPQLAPSSAVTGVQLAKGIGVKPAKGFWAEAWSQVFKRRSAVAALAWLALITFFAVYAPILASGHPLWMSALDPVTRQWRSSSPLFSNLSALDLLLLIWVTLGVPFILAAPPKQRPARLGAFLLGLILAIAILSVANLVHQRLEVFGKSITADLASRATRTGEKVPAYTPFVNRPAAGYIVTGVVAAVLCTVVILIPFSSRSRRIALCLCAGALAVVCGSVRWQPTLERWDYQWRERAGEIKSVYTLIPRSPGQRFSDLSRQPPGISQNYAPIDSATRDFAPRQPLTDEQFASLRDALTERYARYPEPIQKKVLDKLDLLVTQRPITRETVRSELNSVLPNKIILGTDKDGSDVLSQLMHASRLSISIGVVSTSIALLIGVTIGALMGYFGGLVDLFLYRVVEIFMAIPVLFLLIVAVSVLPEELKTTYVIMAIIGCFSWTGIARFTRAEFLKLRNQDFVQSAQAVGLPLRSILFRHMLPNGVAPVLVDTSFAIAAAISIEATLSYLGLGPVDSASWGKLLSSSLSTEGEFKWWLCVFPGGAIFLSVLSYNLLGESLRDAIDPKLKKASV